MAQFRRIVRELHRRSLGQVLGIYAVTSWVIWQVVVSLYEGIGLPDWVPATALILLLIGLPIVLATAFVQEGAPVIGGEAKASPETGGAPRGHAAAQDADAAESPAPARASSSAPGSRLLFTWPRAITGGVLAFAALGLAATGFMGMRTLGIGPAATLVSSGVLTEREPILLSEFGSPSGDSILAAAVTEALRVDLESSQVVSLVQPSQAQAALRRMRVDPATRFSEALAREVAEREGIQAILVGDITAAGPEYVLTARLIRPDGAALTAVRETVSQDGVIEATNRLSSALRERLGESLKSIRAAEPLAQVTTSSLDALRKYSQALRAFDTEPDRRKSIALLGEALEHDSAFAMAWRKLAVAYQYIDRDSVVAAVESAYRHRDRLTDRERYLTEGTYFELARSDTARAMVAYETLLDLYPDEPNALNNLAGLHSQRGEREKASALYARGIEVDPYAAAKYRNRAYVLARLKDYDGVAAVLDAYEEIYPEHYQVPQFRGALAAHRSRYEEAEPLFRRAAELSPDGDAGEFALNSILMIQGRHEGALRGIHDLAGMPQARREVLEASTLAAIRGLHLLDPESAVEELERFATETRLEGMAAEERPYFALILTALDAGRIESAAQFLERWERELPEVFDPPHADLRHLRLHVAAAQGDAAALRAYRRAAEDECLDCWFGLGRIYERAGTPDSAIVAYESYLDPPHPPLFRVNWDRWHLPGVLQRLAILHEEAGDARKAAAHYARFIELWSDADAALQPRVEEARRATARLVGER